MKLTVSYRYIEDDFTPIMYFPTQRMGLTLDELPTDYNIKKAIVKQLDKLNMNIDKIKYLEWWETK